MEPAPKRAYLYDPATGAGLLTVEEAAEYLNYHRISILRLASLGTIKPYRRAGKTLLFLKEDLDRFRLGSGWASRKSSIDKPPVKPDEPSPCFEATVMLDLGLGPAFRKRLETIKNFTWDQIPLIRARIDHQYGNKPFDIEIKSPDGGSWTVNYLPPTWIEKLVTKIKKKGTDGE